MEKLTELRVPPLSEKSGDADAGRFSSASDASDHVGISRFSRQLDSEFFASVSTMSKKPQEPQEGFAQQVASAVASAIELQLHDMTETIVASIRGAYHQESAGYLTQLSSRVVAGLAPELAKAASNAHVNTEHAHSHAFPSTRKAAPCLTAMSRYSSASKSCTSLNSASKPAPKPERDSTAVADGLAEDILRSQGLMADHGPSEALKTRRPHDVARSFFSFVVPEEAQEPERGPAANAASECDNEAWQVQSSTVHVIQTPQLPGEPACDESMCSSPSTGLRRKVRTADDVLQVRIQELTEEIVTRDEEVVPEPDEQERGNVVPACFKIGGIVGWDSLSHSMASLIYQRSALLVIFLAFVNLNYCAALVAQAHSSSNLIEVGERSVLLCDIALAFGCLMGLFSMRPWSGSALLCNVLLLLDAYSQRMGLLERGRKRVFRETLGACVAWCVVIGSAWAILIICSGLKLRVLMSGVSLTVMATLLLCLNYAMQHVCDNLLMFVDAFCCMISEKQEIEGISNDWNTLQAVLRKGARSVEGCFLWIQGTIALAVPLAIADMAVYGVSAEVVAMLVPRFVLILLAFRTLFAAASLTGKCDSVPSVVNSLHFGLHTDSFRQHTVNYILNSAAGFHVCQIRVSLGMAIKYVYIWGVLAFAVFTRFFAA